ncbi:MAG: homoserine kinase [bacterium]|nr:homoserine kinase [bacterium]
MIEVRIPASNSNLGAGFDVIGLALKLYLKVRIEKTEKNVREVVFRGEGSGIINNKNNYIIKTLEKVLKKNNITGYGYKITVDNEIPVKAGLGSSGTAIIAGVIAADHIGSLKMQMNDILTEAVMIEGHPDNITPSLMGGMTASMITDPGDVIYHKIKFPGDIKILAVTPEFNVSTKKAREVLPDNYKLEDATFNMQRTAMFLETFRTKKYGMIPHLFQDRIHQEYRAPLIPGLAEILKMKTDSTFLGVFLSGAGPTIGAFVKDDPEKYGKKIVSIFNKMNINAEMKILKADNRGTMIKEI